MHKITNLKFEFKEKGCFLSLKESDSGRGAYLSYGPDFDLNMFKAIDNIFKKNKIKRPYFLRVYTLGEVAQEAVAKRIVDTFKKASKI